MVGEMIEGHHHIKVGGIDCVVVSDGSRSIGGMTKESPRSFIFGNAPKAELDSQLQSYDGFGSAYVLPFNYLAVRGANGWALIDTGCGVQAENDKNPDEPAGLLCENLIRAGIGVGEVNLVVISHSHWDHFGGAVADDKPVFPNARYVMSSAEVAHVRNRVKGWALDYLHVIEPYLRLVEVSAVLAPGISVDLAPGHTPGLMTVSISSGDEFLQYVSDLVIHPIHVAHPDWCPSFETNRVMAAESRREVIESAYRNNKRVHAPHVQSPGLGRIVKNDGYRWVNES